MLSNKYRKDVAMKEIQNIAETEWQRGTSLVWPALALGTWLQALLLEGSIRPWLIVFGLCLVGATLCTYVLRKMNVKFYSIPLFLTLALSPFFTDKYASGSFISIGLVIFAATIYFAAIEKVWLAVSTCIFLTAFQTWMAFLNLEPVSDSRDLTYAWGYFSISWTMVIGISSIYIRRKYVLTSTRIRNIVDSEMQSKYRKIQQLKQVNEKDLNNQKLHGAILNSLIAIEKDWISFEEKREVITRLLDITKEMNLSENFETRVDTQEQFKKMLEETPLNRLKVDAFQIKSNLENRQMRAATFEIIREIFLNLEKHSLAESVSVKVEKRRDDSISVEIEDDALRSVSPANRVSEMSKVSLSRTLNRILTEHQSSLKVDANRNGSIRTTTVTIPKIDVENEISKELSRLRLTGLDDFVTSYGRAVALGSVFMLFGYFFVSDNIPALVVTALTTVAFLLAVRRQVVYSALSVTTYVSLLIFPLFTSPFEGCHQVLIYPWLFNLVLGLSFLYAVNTRNQIVRWIPLVFLLGQTIIIPQNFPDECKNIFLGSIPGIPIILLIAILVLRIRQREFKLDKGIAEQIGSSARNFDSVDAFREREFRDLVSYVSSTLSGLTLEKDRTNFEFQVKVLIQRIRTFLNFDEHFESRFMQKMYLWSKSTYMTNRIIRYSLLGESFDEFDKTNLLEGAEKHLNQIHLEGLQEVIFIKSASLEIHLNYSSKAFFTPGTNSVEGIIFRYGIAN